MGGGKKHLPRAAGRPVRQGVPRWDRVINVVINETRLSLCISFLRRPDENRIPFCLDESILAFGIQSAALDISK